jgi:stage V sporulation protein G
MPLDADGRAKLYADIAHPINSSCREMIQDCVVREYEEELERSKDPNYVSRYDDFDMDYGDYRRPAATAPHAAAPAETRIDAAHERRGNHAAQHRPPAADVPRGRSATPPAPKSSTPRSVNRPADGFGAGIFPEE